MKAKQPTSATHLWELLQQCGEELSEQYLISIEERMPRVCSAVISAKVATLMSQKFRLNFFQQKDSIISLLSAIISLFYALTSEYIEKLNCLNFGKN